MTTRSQETVLNLPWDVVDACNGLALDIGKHIMRSSGNIYKNHITTMHKS